MKFLDRVKRRRTSMSIQDKFIFFIYSCLIIHFSLLILFCIEKIIPMFLFNIFSVLFYIGLVFMVKGGKVIGAVMLSYFEVQVHAIAAVLFLGFDSGFELYLICVVPIVAFVSYIINKQVGMTYLLGALSAIIFTVLKIHSFYVKPLYFFSSQDVELGVYVYNCFILLAAVLYFTVLIIQEVQKSRKELEKRNEILTFMMEHDSLTKLITRGGMHRHIAKAIEQKKAENIPFGIAFCDIDNFKKFNDTYGHDCGDYVLLNVAKTIEDHVGISGKVCRWGGEEIVILFCGPSEEKMEQLTEQIRCCIEKKDFKYEGKVVKVTITCGIAYGNENSTEAEMIKKADQALYWGKENGKNRVVVYKPNLLK